MRSTHCSAPMRCKTGAAPLSIHRSSFRNIYSVSLHASKLDIANAVATDDRKLSNLLAQPRSQLPEQPEEPKRSFEGVTELLFCSFFWGASSPRGLSHACNPYPGIACNHAMCMQHACTIRAGPGKKPAHVRQPGCVRKLHMTEHFLASTVSSSICTLPA